MQCHVSSLNDRGARPSGASGLGFDVFPLLRQLVVDCLGAASAAQLLTTSKFSGSLGTEKEPLQISRDRNQEQAKVRAMFASTQNKHYWLPLLDMPGTVDMKLLGYKCTSAQHFALTQLWRHETKPTCVPSHSEPATILRAIYAEYKLDPCRSLCPHSELWQALGFLLEECQTLCFDWVPKFSVGGGWGYVGYFVYKSIEGVVLFCSATEDDYEDDYDHGGFHL